MKLLNVIFMLFFIPAMGIAQDGDPYLKGLAAMNKGDLPAAIKEFTGALNQAGRKTDIYIKRATCYYQQAAYRQAINDLKRLEKTQKYPGTYLMAKAYAGMGMNDSAIYYLQIHLQSPDKNPESSIKLDPAFAELEKTRDWINLWNKDWYNEFELLMAELNYLVKSEEYQDALDLADLSMDKYGYHHELHGLRARIFIQLGSNAAAISALSEAITKSNQTVSEYYILRSRAYRASGKPQKALEDLNRAIMLERDNFDLVMERCILRNELGYYADALKDVSYYLQYFPDDPAGLFQKGNIYSGQGNFLKALEWYNKTLKVNAERPEYFLARGQAYLNTKTYTFALRDFSMALDLDPRNKEAYLYKGLARRYMNDPDGACHDWNKAREYGSLKASEYLEKYCH